MGAGSNEVSGLGAARRPVVGWLAGCIGLVATLLVGTGALNAAELQRFSAIEPQMGVEFEVVLYAADEAAAKAAQQAAFARIKQLNDILTDYDSASESLRLCASAPHAEFVPVSEDLYKLLKTCGELNKSSGGAFDPTLGPLTKIWRRARRQKELPSEAALAEAKQAIGWKFVELASDRAAVKLTRANMRLDFGGIAKGYAAEEALRTLQERGIPQALVRGSGDIAVGDPPPGEAGWKVALAPLDADERPTEYLLLNNACVSTSGDARQHLTIDGKRYSHILDPRTLQPIQGRSSVTVVAPHGSLADGLADGLATALSVLGAEAGIALVEQTAGASALLIVEQANKLSRVESKRFGPTMPIPPDTDK